jgi:hypothetical protein
MARGCVCGSPGKEDGVTISLEVVEIAKPEDVNVVVGQAHFIKTVEDLHEALVGRASRSALASPSARLPAPDSSEGQATIPS